MMKKIIAVICVAVMALAVFTACSKQSKTDTSTTSETNVQTTEAAEKVAFPTGTFENEEIRYVINKDGSGEVVHKDNGTGVAIEYKEKTDSNTVTVSFGSPDDTEDIAYEVPDEDTLILKYADGKTYTLKRAEKEDNDDKGKTSLAGTWSDSSVTYVFREDGSGEITDNNKGIGTPFEYEVDGKNITFHMGSADDNTKATFSISGNTLTINYADGNTDVVTAENL